MTMQEKCQYLHWNVQSTHAFQEMRYLAHVDFHTWPWPSVLWNAHHWPDFSWLHSGWSQHDSERLCDISDWQRGLQFQVAKQAAGHLPWKRKALHLQKSVLEKQCDSMVGISAEVKWSETGTAMRSHRMRALGGWSCRSKGPCHATLYPQNIIALMIHVLCGWTAKCWTCSMQITGGWMNLHSKMLLKSKSPAPRHNPWPNAAVDQSYLQLLEIEMMWGFHLHAACHHCIFMIATQTIRSLSGWCSKAWCNSGAWHKVAECATAYERHACRSISTPTVWNFCSQCSWRKVVAPLHPP